MCRLRPLIGRGGRLVVERRHLGHVATTSRWRSERPPAGRCPLIRPCTCYCHVEIHANFPWRTLAPRCPPFDVLPIDCVPTHVNALPLPLDWLGGGPAPVNGGAFSLIQININSQRRRAPCTDKAPLVSWCVCCVDMSTWVYRHT